MVALRAGASRVLSTQAKWVDEVLAWASEAMAGHLTVLEVPAETASEEDSVVVGEVEVSPQADESTSTGH